MSPDLEKRIAALASDRESGASAILTNAMAILQRALADGDDVVGVAKALCRAQPSMAPMWNAAIAALAAMEEPPRFDRFVQRVQRAPHAVARFTADTLLTGLTEGAPLRLCTISFSGTVLHAVDTIARTYTVRVACAEGRPALEGRHLAARLASSGIGVTCYADAAIGHALEESDAVLVGADAVGEAWFINKSGTGMLAAAAAQRGVPVYVLATREKFVGPTVAARLALREAPGAEVWPDPPGAVMVRNPYFERIPLDLVSAVITDVGVLGAASVAELCAGLEADEAVASRL